ncbi:hypothetical protein E4U43_005393 [Claviceps pusilla]|uniref:Uncharacterized protein n=1 Tax=Claviceps pusilla TaxID=123648 RepID=A0A9P7N4X3_9HYPO|nr:hypothetical protein E4U43_005393 [Claviceps pusilla]
MTRPGISKWLVGPVQRERHADPTVDAIAGEWSASSWTLKALELPTPQNGFLGSQSVVGVGVGQRVLGGSNVRLLDRAFHATQSFNQPVSRADAKPIAVLSLLYQRSTATGTLHVTVSHLTVSIVEETKPRAPGFISCQRDNDFAGPRNPVAAQ